MTGSLSLESLILGMPLPLFLLQFAARLDDEMNPIFKAPKRCDWCRKRLRRDYPLLICPDCAKRLGEQLSYH